MGSQAATDQLAIQYSQSVLDQARALLKSLQDLVDQAKSHADDARVAAVAAQAVTIQVGTIRTGTNADAAIVGDGPSKLLNLTFPAAGAVPVAGSDPGIIPVSGVPGTMVGSEGQFALDASGGILYGPKTNGIWPAIGFAIKGDPGPPGEVGPIGSLTIGTITTLQPGATAFARIEGNPPNQVINLGIPQGDKGPTGVGATIKGTVLNYAALPSGGNVVSDLYLMQSAGTDPQNIAYAIGDGYVYVGGSPAWLYVGAVRGPVGSKGESGAQGNPTIVNGKTGTSISIDAFDTGAVLASREAIVDTSYTIQVTDAYVGMVSLSAPRTFTLPQASTYRPGQSLIVVDESGSCSSTMSITLQCVGSDTIAGASSVLIATPYQKLTLHSNGNNLWVIS